MKGKRHTTETKIRILREAQSRDKTIQYVCRERQINAGKVTKFFSKLIDVHWTPEHIRSDNGSEFSERGL